MEIFEEVKKFLEYLIATGRDKRRKSWKFLKKKLGEKKYEIMYDFCVERAYIGSLSYREKKKKDYYIYVRPNGFAFLEEQRRITLQQNQIDSQNFLTWGILSFAIFSGLITMVYYYFDLITKENSLGATWIVGTAAITLLIIIIGIIKIYSKKS